MDHCPQCGRPYGRRKRCYYCQPGKKRSGEMRPCKQCGKEFYARRHVVEDKRGKNTGRYCSNACKHKAMKAITPSWAKPESPIAHSAGYVLIWMPEHPRASRGRVLEHIVVAEEMLGRALLPNETVHHEDGDKTNNDPSNLRVLSRSDHAKMHAAEKRQSATVPA